MWEVKRFLHTYEKKMIKQLMELQKLQLVIEVVGKIVVFLESCVTRFSKRRHSG